MQIYRTSDFQVAVVLSTTDHKLASLDRTNSHRTVFEFESKPETKALVETLFKDELKLNPRHVLTNARLIRDRLHAGL